MRIIVCAAVLVFALSVMVGAAEPAKVSVNASDELLSAVVGRIATEAGVKIVVDPTVDTKVTLSLGESDLPKALDALTKSAKLTWKKVDFAKPADSKVTLDQITSSIVALASMPLVAVSVQDGSGKAGMILKDLGSVPASESVKLPQGYAWSSAYVIFSAAPKAAAKGSGAVGSERLKSLSTMSSDDRKRTYANEMVDMMTLTPEARQQMLADQFSAMQSLSDEQRQQFMRDMFQAMRNSGAGFGGRGGQGGQPGQPGQGGFGGRGNRGGGNRGSNGGGTN